MARVNGVYKFIVTLHVLSAVLIIGPFALAAFDGYRAIQRHDANGTREAAGWMARFGIGSLLVAVLGAGAVFSSDRVTFRTPWIIISLTLYLVLMAVATGYTVPALRKAAKILDDGVLARPVVTGTDSDEQAPPPSISTTATELVTKERLDAVAGRIAGSGGLVLLVIVVITVLMVTRPFGD